MYAIVDDGGHQYKVEEGLEMRLDLRGKELSPGDEFTFDRVLALRDDNGIRVGSPTIEGASVTAAVVGVAQGPKLVVQKFRRRKNSRRKTGHRQWYNTVKITKIDPGS